MHEEDKLIYERSTPFIYELKYTKLEDYFSQYMTSSRSDKTSCFLNLNV